MVHTLALVALLVSIPAAATLLWAAIREGSRVAATQTNH